MTKEQKKDLPVYDFSPEDDLGHIVRYAPIEESNGYDFMEQHRHNYYEVFLFTRGGGTHLIDFVEHTIADCSVHLVRPGQVHLLRRMPGSYGAVFHISKEVSVRLEEVYALLETAAPATAHTEGEFKHITVIIDLLREELESSTSMGDAVFTCLKLLLLKCLGGERDGGHGAAAVSAPQASAFRQLVEANYRTGRLPAWYAGQLHITEKRLNELSKEASGATTGNYIIERRMLEAKRLLANSGGSIKEIGYFLGFDDPAYFTRFFRKNAGMTAGDFRKLHQYPLSS